MDTPDNTRSHAVMNQMPADPGDEVFAVSPPLLLDHRNAESRSPLPECLGALTSGQRNNTTRASVSGIPAARHLAATHCCRNCDEPSRKKNT